VLDVVIIAIGKIKENFYREAINEYLKRLFLYAKIKLIEIKAEPFRNHQDKLKSKKIESERILQALNNYINININYLALLIFSLAKLRRKFYDRQYFIKQ